MKRIVKKAAAALLAFTLTAAVFSGCGSTVSSAASADATAESTSAESAEGGELEEVKAAGKLVIGMGESKALGPFVKACDQFKYLDLILDHGDLNEAEGNAPAASAAETSARAAAGDDTAINRDSIGRIIHGLIDEMDDGTGWVRTSRVGDQLIKRYPDFDVRNFGSKSLNKFLASLPELEVEERILANGNPIQFVRVKPVPEPVKKPAPRRTAKRTTRKKK